MRRSSRWLELVAVLVLVAVAAGWGHSRQAKIVTPVFSSTTVDGISPGMTRSQVLELLGTPGCEGKLKVVDGLGSYMEYGSRSLTWDGHPTVTFHPNGTVLAVVGAELRLKGREKLVRIGDPAVDGLVPANFGPRFGDVDTGTLTITAARSGAVARLVLSEKPTPP